MPEAALAVVPQQPQGGLVVSREWEAQLELVKKTVAPGLTDPEFALFCHVAKVRHLDPLQRQIHAVKRRTWNPDLGEKGGFEDKMTIQTGIDGFRAIANRTGLYMPSDRLPLIEGQGTPDLRVTVWVKKYHPQSGQWHEFGATAYYREFVQTKKGDGGKRVAIAMWEKMPVGQTEKCAEAKALRRGWPEELGQIYADEEMQQADSVTVLPPDTQTKKQDKTQRDLGTLKPSKEPNRGHGNEGLESKPAPQADTVICAECRVPNGHADKCPHHPKNKKMSGEERWNTAEGHDPKVHISWKQGKMLFAIQKDLGLTDDEVKATLDRDFEIQHRYLIRKDDFQKVLDAIDPQFKHHTRQDDAPDPDGSGDERDPF